MNGFLRSRIIVAIFLFVPLFFVAGALTSVNAQYPPSTSTPINSPTPTGSAASDCTGSDCQVEPAGACGCNGDPSSRWMNKKCTVSGNFCEICAYDSSCVSSTCTGICTYEQANECGGGCACGTALIARKYCGDPPLFCGTVCTPSNDCCVGCASLCSGNPTPTTGGNTPTNTPTPLPGIVRARAAVVPTSSTSCADVDGSSDWLTENFSLVPARVPVTKSASGGNYASWTTNPRSYQLVPAGNAGYVLKFVCADPPAAMSKSLTGTLPENGLLSWNLGYTAGTAWSQAIGGDVYAASNVTSAIPAVVPRVFVIDGAGSTPGLVTYGISYDFDSTLGLQGENYVSSKGWLANESYAPADYYAAMFHRYDSPTATAIGDQALTSQLASSVTPYYYDGSVTINTADWTIPSGGNLIVFVSGRL